MSKQLSCFIPVEEHSGLWSAQSATLRCTAIRLTSGGICLYSPVSGLSPDTLKNIQNLGEVKILLAPNHYHNKGLKEYLSAFPNAHLCCSSAAKPRLQKITGLEFEDLENLIADLPEGADILEPDGLKTGEIWISARANRQVAWIMADTFSGPKGKPGHVADKVQLLGTFPKFGIADKQFYSTWLKHRVNKESPSLVIPCHGSMIQSPSLAEDLKDALENAL
ncbi:MAG: hypothetical protein ABJN40_00285 [Sneathiella sp.]